jgi:tRNA(adenine34) deaminase
MNDIDWMRLALQQAQLAFDAGEVPVGALLVRDDEVLAEGFNCPIGSHDPTAHAEIVVLRDAARKLGNYRLPGTTLYVTIEPCAMCVGAMIHARVERVVFGAPEPRAGAVVSSQRMLDATHFNHRIAYEGGVLADACGAIMQQFFRAKRQRADA